MADSSAMESATRYLVSVALIVPLYLAYIVIYRLYFHPLARFPGPILHRISRIPYFYAHTTGTQPFDMLPLHQKYGNIVRIAPDELAFSHPDAWNDIMGHKKGGASELEKAPWFYRPLYSEATQIINESREQHGRLRRQVAHGFSDKSMKAQESIIKGYVDLLMNKLRERCVQHGKGEPVAISEWYNYCTFDIIGDLAFGEPFGCLVDGVYNPWIKSIFESGRAGTILQAIGVLFPALKDFILSNLPASVRKGQEEHKQRTKEKMMRRIAKGNDRPDLIAGLIAKQEELGLDVAHLAANAEVLIVGGSETTATVLSGVTYLLLRNPKVLETLVKEVRGLFKSEDEITMLSVTRLEYMLAVLNEALRVYPPVASGLPRLVPEEGATICGQYVAGGMTVSMVHWALYRREEYFRDASEFHPERWLGDEKYKNDRKDALQPFQVGPRNCVGKNLAYSEMRLILARVLFNFDMRLADESVNWMKQRNFLLWEKGPLKVYLTEAVR